MMLLIRLQESKFEKLMRSSFPKADLSGNDVSVCRRFIQFVMKVTPELRPSMERIKHHFFLKSISNPLMTDCYEILARMSRNCNPSKRDQPNTDTISTTTETSQDKGI